MCLSLLVLDYKCMPQCLLLCVAYFRVKLMGFVFHRCWGIELRFLGLQSKHVNMVLTEIQSQLNSYGLDRSVVYMFVCSLLFKHCLPEHHPP